jgi:hypothetical protein
MEGAESYYKNVISKEVGFDTSTHPNPSTLDTLLDFFGYLTVRGAYLEAVEPKEIEDRFKGGQVLITRFFAPKITDVSGDVAGRKYGWRKLVRLRALPGSHAEAAGLKSMYLLFNVFNDNLDISPFKVANGSINHSIANQVILVRNPLSKLPRPAYFLTFDKIDNSGISKLSKSFPATFDASSVGGEQQYFVPASCEQCHGEFSPKLNYLDTDHWFNRVAPGNDFSLVKKKFVLFDAGTETVSDDKYTHAVNVIRTLNTEIRDQNRDADGACPSFQQMAAESWLQHHAVVDAPLPLFDRSITATGPYKWSKSEAEDVLPLLERYCYRCHSSIKYHIYDKSAVLLRKGAMIARINEARSSHFRMPQDRTLSDAVKCQLTLKLSALKR